MQEGGASHETTLRTPTTKRKDRMKVHSVSSPRNQWPSPVSKRVYNLRRSSRGTAWRCSRLCARRPLQPLRRSSRTFRRSRGGRARGCCTGLLSDSTPAPIIGPRQHLKRAPHAPTSWPHPPLLQLNTSCSVLLPLALYCSVVLCFCSFMF